MAISKRTRFEVLRRDSHTCRYCGASAPDVKLHVDHVVPVALGGTDDPTNLVTACVDCNNGKASTSPDAEVVADVADDALRWARAMDLAGEQINTLTSEQEEYIAAWGSAWLEYNVNGKMVYLPPNWEAVLVGYYNSHLPRVTLVESVHITMARPGVRAPDRFRYFCGVVRNRLNQQAEIATRLIEQGVV